MNSAIIVMTILGCGQGDDCCQQPGKCAYPPEFQRPRSCRLLLDSLHDRGQKVLGYVQKLERANAARSCSYSEPIARTPNHPAMPRMREGLRLPIRPANTLTGRATRNRNRAKPAARQLQESTNRATGRLALALTGPSPTV